MRRSTSTDSDENDEADEAVSENRGSIQPIVAGSAGLAARHTVLGAVTSFLGLLARLVRPVFWIAAIRLYGPDAAGQFAIAVALLELTRQFTSSGIADAVVLFTSREIGRPDGEDRLYQALATAIWLTAVTGAVVVGFVVLGGHIWIATFTQRELLGGWGVILVWGIPLLALAETLIAATRAHMVMKWHALILGALQPGLQVAFVLLFYSLGFGANGLAWAWLLGIACTLLAALPVFGHYFDLSRLALHVLRPRWHGELMRFTWPQNLNMTFNYFATNLDVLMLAALSVPSAQIALYYAAVQLTRNLRSIKVAFGLSFGPVIARFHVDRRTAELATMYHELSRLALSLVLPATLVVGALQADLLRLFDPSFTDRTGFVFLLLALPILSCGLGLSGNIVVMTGLSGWNALNSIVAALLNFTLNLWLIPAHGLLGAALATLLAAAFVQGLTLLELRWLLHIRVAPAQLLRPLAGAALIAAGLFLAIPRCSGTGQRLVVTALALLAYFGWMWRVGMRPDERERVLRRLDRGGDGRRAGLA